MMGRKARALSAALVVWLALAACASAPQHKKTVNRQAEQYFRLGQVNFTEGKNQEAIANLKKSIQLDPGNADARGYLGTVYFLLSDYANAEKELLEAVKLNPYDTDSKNSLGAVYTKTRRPEKALAIFEEALKDRTYPSPEKILYNLGTLHLEAKRYPQAEDAFRRAVAANAGYAKGYYGLGLALADTGRTEDARASFRKVISLAPKSPEAIRAQEYLARQATSRKG